MNWHQTIEFIRKKPEYSDLVRLSYFEENLVLNVERFRDSEEFSETLKILKEHIPGGKTILDIGAGNGISSINLALSGYTVTVVEPDPSNSVGASAIRNLQQHYNLNNISIYEKYAEEIGFASNSFDILYVRQAMHHAYDLKKFISECARVLKPGGILLTVRDHIIFNQKDKKWFLETHPLHKYYGGENAFTAFQYKDAMVSSGLNVIKEIKYFDSVINYFPTTTIEMDKRKRADQWARMKLKKWFGFLSKSAIALKIFKKYWGVKTSYGNEMNEPGRMYSYIATKLKT